MQIKEWTPDIRLTLINTLVEELLGISVLDMELGTHAETYDRIHKIASQSDHFLNHFYDDVMQGKYRHSPRLEWPRL